MRRLALQHQTCIAQRGFHLGLAFAQVVEIVGGDVDHLRVDLVHAEIVALLPVGGQRAGAQADDAHALLHRVDALDGHADAG